MFTLGGRLLATTLQGSKQAALGTRFCAEVQSAQLQEVLVFCQLFTGQVKNHQTFLQETTALCDGTHQVCPTNKNLKKTCNQANTLKTVQ